QIGNGGSYQVPTLAVIDGGFDLDTTTGLPRSNLDYNNELTRRPAQFASVGLVSGDSEPNAGGENAWDCGGEPCPWHGQECYSIAAGVPANRFGTAGSAGHYARPLLVRVDPSSMTVAGGIRGASILGASVISLSLVTCVDSWYCSTPFYDAVGALTDAVAFATGISNAVVLASAGNDGHDVGDSPPLPCGTGRVICVGAIDFRKMNQFNWGARVDIW